MSGVRAVMAARRAESDAVRVGRAVTMRGARVARLLQALLRQMPQCLRPPRARRAESGRSGGIGKGRDTEKAIAAGIAGTTSVRIRAATVAGRAKTREAATATGTGNATGTEAAAALLVATAIAGGVTTTGRSLCSQPLPREREALIRIRRLPPLVRCARHSRSRPRRKAPHDRCALR